LLAVLWKCAGAGDHPAGYSATVLAQGGGPRQYVVMLLGKVVGVSARDGKCLWGYDKMPIRIANSYAPLVRNDLVFCACGYGAGLALLRLVPEKEGTRVEEKYYHRRPMPSWHDTTVLVGEHVYAGTNAGMACFELLTGKAVWEERGAVGGNASVTCADGHLYLRSQQGKVALVEATPERYTLRGLLQVPGAVPKRGSTAPVVAGGRLYLRDDDVLFCYDVKEGAAPDRPGPPRPPGERAGHDVFVPTPQDVVEKMLELANVRRGDVVYDLGCGDGRVVVTAARKYGCKAVGFDIDPECVRLARENVRKHDVGGLVTVEQKDLFTADLSRADVIALYLLPRTLERLAPRLQKLRPGVRIVSHAFEVPGFRPDRVETYTSRDGLPNKLYLWTTPLKSLGRGK
jgi:precorrin-6B methylase 2/outer membrane protein assembly factor BamB